MSGIILASVAVQNVTYHIDKLYDYKVPAERASELVAGCRVLVSFGKASQLRQGIVISVRALGADEDEPEGLREIADVLKDAPIFTPKMIQLAQFMKERTFCTLFDALKTMLPGSGNAVKNASVRMVKLELGAEEYAAKNAGKKLTAKQAAVADELARIGTCSVKELCYFTGVTEAVVKALEAKGLVSLYDKEVYRRPYESKFSEASEITLTSVQNEAFCSLCEQYKGGGGTSLLYGVTGSGKTQVYLKLIDEVLKDGKDVIVMVPEISLTPQTLQLFNSRYGDSVAVFHSALSAGERYDEWRRVKEGKAKIAVGTRSAVFAPLENLGLIIMDEEQEHTYKSEQSPRYHARDIARYRCAEDKALLVLASATPSFESFTAAKSGKYTLNILKERYGTAVLPTVEVVDMCKERKDGNRSEISRSLLAGLMKNLDEWRQSILLINRRGYNTFASCGSCGEVMTCPNCSISLTYHRANNRLMCHYCGYSVPFSKVCSTCGEPDMQYMGSGTQKIEDEIGSLLPGAKILRMDSDSTMQKFSFDEKLAAFAEGKYDIMIGTQMVAKGLDFENVTLVGVLSADQQLYSDDYKSMENTFDLLTQVIGRAGRGKYPGKAVIQTINPANEVIKLAAEQDFESFYDMEMLMRRAMIYPPYCSIYRIVFQSMKEEKVQKSAVAFLNKLKSAIDNKESGGNGIKLIALGPMPEPLYRVNGKYRFRILIKCKNDKKFRSFLSELLYDFGNDGQNSGVTAIADIN